MNTSLTFLKRYKFLDSYKNNDYYGDRSYDAGFNDAIDGIIDLISDCEITVKKKKRRTRYADDSY